MGHRQLPVALLCVGAFFLSGCGGGAGGGSMGSASPGTATLTLSFGTLARQVPAAPQLPPSTANLVVTVLAGGGTIASQTISVASPTVAFTNLPLTSIQVVVQGQTAFGVPSCQGQASLTLLPGQNVATVTLSFLSQFFYSLNLGAGTLEGFSLDATTGATQPLPGFPISDDAGGTLTKLGTQTSVGGPVELCICPSVP